MAPRPFPEGNGAASGWACGRGRGVTPPPAAAAGPSSPARLYEQERMGAGAPDALGMYVRRWFGWARAGLGIDGGKGKTATLLVRRMADLAERPDVRRPPSVSCASRLSPT